jgi:hypothetical protein
MFFLSSGYRTLPKTQLQFPILQGPADEKPLVCVKRANGGTKTGIEISIGRRGWAVLHGPYGEAGITLIRGHPFQPCGRSRSGRELL